MNAHAGRIVAIAGTADREWLEAQSEIHAIVNDFRGLEQYII